MITPSTPRRQLRVSLRKLSSPGVSTRWRSCFFQVRSWKAAEMVILRDTSSGSKSRMDEPLSTLPKRLVCPASKSMASAMLVLPEPPCPSRAKVRVRSTVSLIPNRLLDSQRIKFQEYSSPPLASRSFQVQDLPHILTRSTSCFPICPLSYMLNRSYLKLLRKIMANKTP